MKYLILYCAVFLALTVFLIPRYGQAEGQGKKALAIALKMIPTVLAAGPALYACCCGKNGIAGWILAGILVGSVADGLLCIRFEVGGVAFLIGHLLYCTAFVRAGRVGWINIILALTVWVCLVLFLLRIRTGDIKGLLLIAIAGYLLSLACTFAFSLRMPPAFFAIGAFFFLVGDVTMFRNRFCGAGDLMNGFSLGIYYVAQLLLAIGAYFT